MRINNNFLFVSYNYYFTRSLHAEDVVTATVKIIAFAA